MTINEKCGVIMEEGTKNYFEHIKDVLANKSKMIECTSYIPFVYDEMKLKQMCEKEGINMNYASSYRDDEKYNPYMPLDKLVFTRKRVK